MEPPQSPLPTRALSDTQPIAGLRPAQLAFFLDVDGTLLEFASAPEAVRVTPAIPALLRDLTQLTGGAVALISGRPLDDLERLFPDLGLPAAGQHGAERRDTSGVRQTTPLEEASWRFLRAEAQQAQRAHPRLLIEDKGRSIAIHYRRFPALAALAHWLALSLAGLSRGEFVVQRGHYVEEIKSAAADKGSAIARFMEEAPFVGRRPVFLGDDVTDEDGFRVVNRQGGVSIKVGAGVTAARWRLRDPAAVCNWLAKAIAQLRESSAA